MAIVITGEAIILESKRASRVSMGQIAGQMNSVCGGAST